MAKTATIKDILCATEFGGEALVKRRQGQLSHSWALEPSGIKVASRDADKAIATGALKMTKDSHYTIERYVFRAPEAAPADAAE